MGFVELHDARAIFIKGQVYRGIRCLEFGDRVVFVPKPAMDPKSVTQMFVKNPAKRGRYTIRISKLRYEQIRQILDAKPGEIIRIKAPEVSDTRTYFRSLQLNAYYRSRHVMGY